MRFPECDFGENWHLGGSGQGQVRTWVRADVHKSGRVRYYCGSPRMLDNPIGDVIQFRPILENLQFYIFKDRLFL